MDADYGKRTNVVGKSLQNRDITLFSYGEGFLPVLLLGGVHGDESEGFLFAERMVRELDQGEISLPAGITLHIAPRINPDGCEVLRRTNHRNVDLNRNLPTKDWTGDFINVRYFPGERGGSEVETITTLDLIRDLDPALILTLHSYEKPMINFNGECEDLAVAMSKKNNLHPQGDIGYPTPGSLGTYAGWERNIPTITLEILRGQEPEEVWHNHRDALLVAFGYYLENPRPARKEP